MMEVVTKGVTGLGLDGGGAAGALCGLGSDNTLLGPTRVLGRDSILSFTVNIKPWS